jgi:hypothetical protein
LAEKIVIMQFPLLVRENHLELTELSSIKEFQFPHMVTLDQQGIGTYWTNRKINLELTELSSISEVLFRLAYKLIPSQL